MRRGEEDRRRARAGQSMRLSAHGNPRFLTKSMGVSWSSRNQQQQQQQIAARCDCSQKRQKRMIEQQQHWQQLIPGLPDEVAMHVLARVTRSSHPVMKTVCRSWNQVMNSGEIYELRHQLGVSEQWLYVLMKDREEELVWFAVDSHKGDWRRLPQMPEAEEQDQLNDKENAAAGGGLLGGIWDASSQAITGVIKALFRRRDPVERIPFFGCSAAELHGFLFVLGGFFKASATSSVWRYDPRKNVWSRAASMGNARAYCKTGVLDGRLYAVGGVNRGRNGLTPLQTAEVYDPAADSWSAVPGMPFRGAQVLPQAFVTDILKPIATGMASLRGKLWVPQSLYSWPFFMDVGGEVFDPLLRIWSEMPAGMGDGWPARQAGMKLSVVVDGRLYSLDPLSSLDGCKIKVYDFEQDCWRVVVKKVPVVLDVAADSESPYLLGCLNRRLHVVTRDVYNNVTVLRAQIDGCGGPPTAEGSDSVEEPWTVVAAKRFGRVELVACQVLEL